MQQRLQLAGAVMDAEHPQQLQNRVRGTATAIARQPHPWVCHCGVAKLEAQVQHPHPQLVPAVAASAATQVTEGC